MGRADAGENRGYTLRRLRTIIAGLIAAEMRKRARSMRRTSARFWIECARKDAGLAHSSPKLCRALPGKLCFRRIIWRKCIGGCVLRERCALRMKCKWDSGD